MTNEAAKQLLLDWQQEVRVPLTRKQAMMDEALADERRATVERIRDVVTRTYVIPANVPEWLTATFDAERDR